MKKRIIAIMLVSVALIAALAGCSGSDDTADASEGDNTTEAAKSITITHDLGDLEVPINPERIAILDLAALDVIDNLGEGDHVVGLTKGSMPSYLESYASNDALENLGNLKEADFEALMSIEPDIIFIGGRLSEQYDEFAEIAPTVLLTTDNDLGLYESVKKNSNTIARIFEKEDQITSLTADFDERIDAIQKAAEGNTTLVGMVTSGNFNAIGESGRCSIISNELGFENVADDVDATHGDSSSFELILEKNPDYIFVLDRDTAIQSDGAASAQQVMENEIVQKTDAYKNDQIVYLTPEVWYLAEGGITAFDVMLEDVEKGIL